MLRQGYPGVAQLVARVLWEHQAAGSNPVTRTKNTLSALIRREGVFCYGKNAENVTESIAVFQYAPDDDAGSVALQMTYDDHIPNQHDVRDRIYFSDYRFAVPMSCSAAAAVDRSDETRREDGRYGGLPESPVCEQTEIVDTVCPE